MEIESTALFQEIKAIIDDGPKPVNYYYKCYFLIDDKKYEPLKIIDVFHKRNYVEARGDERFITLAIPMGLWSKIIYPKLNILDITLVKIPIYEIDDKENQEEEIEEIRYTAIPVPDSIPNLTGDNLQRFSIAALDTMDFFEVTFQLVDKGLEALKMVTVGSVFRRCKTEDVVKGILAKERSKAKTITGKAVETIDMVDGDNDDEIEHVLIPQGLPYLDVPFYVQQQCNGVYNAGMNIYYQNKGLFVYPPFDTTRYDSADLKATILKVPKYSYSYLERTYRQEGDIVYIIGTSDSSFEDKSFINSRNRGDGIRFGDARFIMRDELLETKDNKTKIVRKDVNQEFVSKDKSDQPDYRQQLYVPLSKEHMNANPFVQRSRLAHINGAMYQIDWQNSNPDVLIPGMMVKIIYMSKHEFRELYGVLTHVVTNTQLSGQGLNYTRHITNSSLFIFSTMLTEQEQEFDEIDESVITAWENYEMG
jgi:hypothetical protein